MSLSWIASGYQHWRQLLFVHWPIPASTLRSHVPAPLSIDEFDGSAYVSLVAFVVYGLRPSGVPRRFGLRFLETNVRTYVHLNGAEHGVYFFSLDAESLPAVLGARLSLGLPYFWATGSLQQAATHTRYALSRRGRRRPGCFALYEVGDHLGPAAPGTLDHFLVERYALHSVRGPSVWSVRVEHQPYPLHHVTLHDLRTGLVDAAGIDIRGRPPVVHYATGVDVRVLPRQLMIMSGVASAIPGIALN